MKPELKRLLVLNLPYLLFVYLFAKCGQAYRLAAGVDASAKLLHLTSGISAAFANPLPSLHPFDLCVGLAGAVAVRLIVYSKGKNAKKYRKGEEYGSARWGTAKDIAPYIDPKFENNILLTQTERLTMTGRPKDPKTARNKNLILVIKISELHNASSLKLRLVRRAVRQLRKRLRCCERSNLITLSIPYPTQKCKSFLQKSQRKF